MTTSASQSISLRTLGNSDLQAHPHRLWRMGHRRGRLAILLGPPGRQRLHCRHSSRARSGHQLDRYRGHLRAGPLGRGGGARRQVLAAQALHLHQVLHALARRPLHLQLAQGRIRWPRRWRLRCGACGVETIDLYQVHWPNPDDEIEEGWEALARLREQGKIRWIGVSNFSVDQMKRAQKIAPITSLQPPYSMLRRAVEAEILPFAQANGIGVINYSPMVSGLLTGKMTRRARGGFAGRRLAPQKRRIQRAAFEPQSAPGGAAARDRQRAWRKPRRSGRGLDAAPSRNHRRHRRRAQRKAGGRDGSRAPLPAQRGGV